MDAQLKAQLRQVIGVATSATIDYAGQVQVGSAATYYARVEPRYRELYRELGVVEKTTHMVILSEDFNLTETQGREMLLWLPGDSIATTQNAKRILSLHPCYDENGALDHWEVMV